MTGFNLDMDLITVIECLATYAQAVAIDDAQDCDAETIWYATSIIRDYEENYLPIAVEHFGEEFRTIAMYVKRHHNSGDMWNVLRDMQAIARRVE